MVHTDAFNGAVDRYPFAFERFGLSNNTDSTDLLGYERFLQEIGAYRERKDPMVLPGDWGDSKTCTLFLFNNVPSGYPDDPAHRNPQQTGNVRYELTFSQATTHTITVLVWSEYKNLIEINHQGGIRYNV